MAKRKADTNVWDKWVGKWVRIGGCSGMVSAIQVEDCNIRVLLKQSNIRDDGLPFSLSNSLSVRVPAELRWFALLGYEEIFIRKESEMHLMTDEEVKAELLLRQL